MKFIWILLISITFGYSQAYISVDKTSFTVKEDISVFITGMSGDKKDWIGIYPVGTSNAWENVVSWIWTDGANDTSIQLPKIAQTGLYEARAFFKNSYNLEATSKVFEIKPASDGAVKLRLPDYHQVTCQRNLLVQFENMAGNINDWIALYPVKSNNEWQNVVLWKWIKNRQNGSIDLDPKENFQVGEYEARAFFNNSFNLEAISNPIFITPCNNAVILDSKKEFFKNEDVIVNFENMSNDPKNWIGIYKKGKKTLAENILAWKWTGNKQKGQLIFKNLPQGEYDIRAFFNNTYTPQQIRSFKITNLTEENFPKVLLTGNQFPMQGVEVKYSKDKNRAYIFVDDTSIYKDNHNGITAINYSDKNNPTILTYLAGKTWRKNTIHITENERILTYLDKSVFPHIITLDINNNLELLHQLSTNYPVLDSYHKADGLDLFFTIRPTAEHGGYKYYFISYDGQISPIIEHINDGASDYYFISSQGKINNNQYQITYTRRLFDGNNGWGTEKKIYDISNLPNMPLVDTIVSP